MSKFAEGLSHEDSVVQPPFKANTFNWVMGHILVSRQRVLALLGQPTVMGVKESVRYESGAEPVTLETAVSLARLLNALKESQEAIITGLENATDDLMEAIADKERQQTVGDRIAGLHWHETYHVGQLEILRQVSGEREAFP
jgi:hypothetical protein